MAFEPLTCITPSTSIQPEEAPPGGQESFILAVRRMERPVTSKHLLLPGGPQCERGSNHHRAPGGHSLPGQRSRRSRGAQVLSESRRKEAREGKEKESARALTGEVGAFAAELSPCKSCRARILRSDVDGPPAPGPRDLTATRSPAAASAS
ncbi:hypothetical protein EYF80_041978 [Liparis tanakae]|uniref:Uncharacterized protein n=1 Tax=Liparis tanakae TaxID=230148 RepID=A0A4Z2G446_9TELE|nr:hypothetical protein EYF80_041978 [Liparis tanakae]